VQTEAHGAIIPFDAAGESDLAGGLASLCALAGTQPEAFIDSLSWEVADDLGPIAGMDIADGTARPFQSPIWMQSWLDTFGARSKARPRILCGRLGGTLVIAIPLCLERRGPATRARFIAQDVSDYNHPLLHPALAPHADGPFMEALWKCAAAMLTEADYFSLRKLLVAPPFARGGGSAEAEKSHWLAISGDWAQNEDRFFGATTRHSMSRKAKKLAAIGPLSSQEIAGAQQRGEAMAKLVAWKAGQLHELGAANPFRNEAFVAFLMSLSQGNPQVHRLFGFFAGKELLAVTYVICEGKRWFLYQTAYTDAEARRFSPGLFLLRHIMQATHDAGAMTFDFGLGNEGYKERFCDQHRMLYRAEIPVSTLGRAAVLATAGWAGLRELSKSHPAVRRTALFALQALAAVQQRLKVPAR